MRLFYAVDIMPVSSLKKLTESLRSIQGVRVPSDDSLHITLRFLGDVDKRKIPELREILDNVGEHPSFSVTLQSVGAFPNELSPRVIWVGVEDGGILQSLVSSIEEELKETGFPLERRPFKPHLTVGRLRKPDPMVIRTVERWKTMTFGVQAIKEIRLKSSVLTPSGPRYRDEYVVNLVD